MSNHPVVEYSEDALSNPVCPRCGERATARMGEREGRAVAEFWDANAHVWFVRLPEETSHDMASRMTPMYPEQRAELIARAEACVDAFIGDDATKPLSGWDTRDWRTMSVTEIAAENPSVAAYIAQLEREARAEAEQQKVADHV